MAWTWRYENTEGVSVAGPVEAFGNQSDAESWLGQNWRQLAEVGVAKVTLFEGERVEYDMSLLPPD